MNTNDPLRDFSISPNTSFIEEFQLASTSVMGTVYGMFGFELLHNLHLDISKLLNECTFKYFGLVRVTTKPSGVVEKRQPQSKVRVCILRGANSLRAAIDLKAYVLGLHVYFYSMVCSM